MNDHDSEQIITRAGVRLHVRRTRDEDEPALAAFFASVTPEDLRFRFLATLREVGHDRLVAMIRANDARNESLIAFVDDGSVAATAILASDGAGKRAEAAVVLRGDLKGQGVGWSLLDHLVSRARARGYAVIEFIEGHANRSALEIEREMGFEEEVVDGDPSLVQVSRFLR
ncbi:GNAT family N-acetyltransferase [Brevundimonas sp. PAMC22021]|uniref:GNAT family N-acetyltransferase n=1 Tax=Brevundimonas sp. PAMC22021 TaxID=2861285 RepID=UPI001C628DCC|nr:GNAT family N-acetyltransferase [Brevundimonas sp. PAMC22021]QYF87019.1 GNAT family N-acetyltransferase [Brevundimonas sp. PAMC22021]